MKISKKVPVIVCTVILLFCIFAGYIHANSRYFLSDQRQFLYTVTLKEGVSIVDTSQAIDAFLDGKPYEPSDIDIPAGSEGYINLMYGHLQSYITDPETNTSRFQVDFYQDDKHLGQGRFKRKGFEVRKDIVPKHGERWQRRKPGENH